MTIILPVRKKCAVCGTRSEYPEIGSTNAFGAPDLDMRPPEMQRSTINMKVQKCPDCGYCAPDISSLLDKATEVVFSDAYKQQLNSSEFPELANAFLCLSMIYQNAENYVKAGRACIHAAWVCDDADSDVAAQKCRKKAVTFLQKAREKGQRFVNQMGAEEALMVDLLRRSKQFDLALKICEEGLKKNPEKIIVDILNFQKTLISKKDVACHTIDEVTGGFE